ncbi:MAG TPA: hypothetical protein VMS81_00250 [Methanomicrobiales archaeon]|nr:hypothetical protein [Methanomicrobiales archaeon]
MEKRRQVTEEDLLVTEEMIARSYAGLKQSVRQAPSQALGSLGTTVRKHPVASAAAAIGAGIAIYGLFRLVTRHRAVRENVTGSREQRSRPDMTMEILSMIIPVVTPYIAGYLQKYMGRAFSGDRDEQL